MHCKCKSKCLTSRCPCKAGKTGCSVKCSCTDACHNKAASLAALASTSASAAKIREQQVSAPCCMECNTWHYSMHTLLTESSTFSASLELHSTKCRQCRPAAGKCSSAGFPGSASGISREGRRTCTSWNNPHCTSYCNSQVLQMWSLLSSICSPGAAVLPTGSWAVLHADAALPDGGFRWWSCSDGREFGTPHWKRPRVVVYCCCHALPSVSTVCIQCHRPHRWLATIFTLMSFAKNNFHFSHIRCV